MLPVGLVLIFFREFIIVILTNAVVLLVFLAVDFGRTILLELVLQLKVGAFTVSQRLVFLQRNLLIHTIIVRTIVGDVQFTIATHYRQVTTTIETASMLGTYRDEVTMEDIIQRSSRIAKDGRSIVIAFAVRRYITTCKHSIADLYTTLNGIVRIDTTISFLVTSKQVCPFAVSLICWQCIQILCRHILVRSVCNIIVGHTLARLHLQHWCDNNLTVFCQLVIRIIVVIMVW